MKKEYQKYWLCGIIGAVCFGIGDWLLGYVDPGIVNRISSADHPDRDRQNSTATVDVPFKSGDLVSAETYSWQTA